MSNASNFFFSISPALYRNKHSSLKSLDNTAVALMPRMDHGRKGLSLFRLQYSHKPVTSSNL